jgi:excisionase family DNA binding protein
MREPRGSKTGVVPGTGSVVPGGLIGAPGEPLGRNLRGWFGTTREPPGTGASYSRKNRAARIKQNQNGHSRLRSKGDGVGPHHPRARGFDFAAPLLDVREAARLLNCRPSLVRSLAHRGELAYVRVGVKLMRFRPADVDEYVAAHRLPRRG